MNKSSKQRSCVFDEDGFSGLPDVILIHILSLLPLEDVVKGFCLVNRRFHQLWPFIHTLNFDQCMFPGHNCGYYNRASYTNYDEKFLMFVRHVLLLHKSPTIDKFCLKFHFRSVYSFWQRASGRRDVWQYELLRSEKRMTNEIGTWIQFALNKNLKVLDLSFSKLGTDYPEATYALPNCVLSCPHLVELRLAYCKINSKRKSGLESLKTLYLDNIMIMDQSLDHILSGCPVLEELTLQLCHSQERVVLLNSNLKTLKLGISLLQPRIHVSCPNLLSFDMSGALELLDIANVAAIAEVSIKYNLIFDFKWYNEKHDMRILLQTFTGAKTLKLCSWSALAFYLWQLNNLPSPTLSCKSVHLQLDFVIWHLPGILNLLKHCPCLENLVIKITSYNESKPNNTLSWIHPYEFDAGEYRSMVDAPVQCLTHHLKMVKVAGFVMKKQVIRFLEYLLGHSMVLKKMKIFSKEETSDPNSLMSGKAHEYEERLLNAPKASASAAVLFY